MSVLDTSVIIYKIKDNASIHDNVTEITVLEFPPILKYPKFYGRIYYLRRSDLNLALKIQLNLRKIGAQKPIPDILIAAICINRNEELITMDDDFIDISRVTNLKTMLIARDGMKEQEE